MRLEIVALSPGSPTRLATTTTGFVRQASGSLCFPVARWPCARSAPSYFCTRPHRRCLAPELCCGRAFGGSVALMALRMPIARRDRSPRGLPPRSGLNLHRSSSEARIGWLTRSLQRWPMVCPTLPTTPPKTALPDRAGASGLAPANPSPTMNTVPAIGARVGAQRRRADDSHDDGGLGGARARPNLRVTVPIVALSP